METKTNVAELSEAELNERLAKACDMLTDEERICFLRGLMLFRNTDMTFEEAMIRSRFDDI